MADTGASRTAIVAMCPAGQPAVLRVAQAIGIVAMLVVLALVVIAAVSVVLAGRAYSGVVEDAKAAGHLAVDHVATLAQSPYVAKAFAAGRALQADARQTKQAVTAATTAARGGAAAYSLSSACYRWLVARQGAWMRGEPGQAQALCPAAEAAVRDAQAGMAGGACPPEPGPPPRPQHGVYRAFLDAQCPWQRAWGVLRPQGQ